MGSRLFHTVVRNAMVAGTHAHAWFFVNIDSRLEDQQCPTMTLESRQDQGVECWRVSMLGGGGGVPDSAVYSGL